MKYKDMYTALFNAVTTSVEILNESTSTTPEIMKSLAVLRKAQELTEEMYINNGKKPTVVK